MGIRAYIRILQFDFGQVGDGFFRGFPNGIAPGSGQIWPAEGAAALAPPNRRERRGRAAAAASQPGTPSGRQRDGELRVPIDDDAAVRKPHGRVASATSAIPTSSSFQRNGAVLSASILAPLRRTVTVTGARDPPPAKIVQDAVCRRPAHRVPASRRRHSRSRADRRGRRRAAACSPAHRAAG